MWYQFFLIWKGLTSYEFSVKELQDTGNPFDLGPCKNFFGIFCKYKKSKITNQIYSLNLNLIGENEINTHVDASV